MKKLVFLFSFFTAAANATIYFDLEKDPLPLIEIEVVIPNGFEVADSRLSALANLMPDIIESGTKKIDRQDFLESLADFGATHGFDVSNQYSIWQLTFPIVEGQDMDRLAQLLSDNWNTPRFEEKTFHTAKVKLESALTASFDRDFALGGATLKRWMNMNIFSGNPVFLENVKNAKLKDTQENFEKNFLEVKDIWVGAIGPESAKPLIKTIVQKIFKKQGDIQEGVLLKKLPTVYAPNEAKPVTKVALIIDKSDRNQTITAMMAVRPKQLSPSEELSFFFGNHIFFDSGLASVFGTEIRTKRGLAYAVSSIGGGFLNFPMISLSMNPVRERTDEALKVTTDLINDSFASTKTINELPEEQLKNQWQSFINGRLLQKATPSSRLSERQSVVLGGISPEFYQTKSSDLKLDRKKVSEQFTKLWKDSLVSFSFVGSAEELTPLIKRHFPDYKIIVIPYKDTLKKTAYQTGT